MIQNKLTSEIPGGWSISSLEDVAEIVSGVTKGRKLLGRATTWVPYLRVANVQAGHLNLEEIKKIKVPVEEVDKYRLQPGDVVMTEGGDPDKLGRGTVWNGEVNLCLHQNHIFRVRPNVEMLDSHYLKAYLGSKSAQKYFLRCAKQTTGIASINKTQLRAFPVPLPPIEEQRRIAAILDKADAVRRKRKEAIALTEELLRSAFLEMFGEYFTSRYAEAFEDVSDVLVDCRNKTAPYVDEGIPLIRTTNFRDCRLELSDLRYVTPAINATWSARHQTAPGDIVYAREAPFGMAAMIPEGFFPCLGQRIMVSRPNQNLVLPEYLLFVLNSSFVYKQALEVAVGSTVKHLRVADVNQLQIPVPPMHLQEKFVTLHNQAEENRIRQIDQEKQGTEFFNSLLQGAFRGEL